MKHSALVYTGIQGLIVTVGLGTLSFLTFQFVNRLAVSELYFLYDSILPRDRYIRANVSGESAAFLH